MTSYQLFDFSIDFSLFVLEEESKIGDWYKKPENGSKDNYTEMENKEFNILMITRQINVENILNEIEIAREFIIERHKPKPGGNGYNNIIAEPHITKTGFLDYLNAISQVYITALNSFQRNPCADVRKLNRIIDVVTLKYKNVIRDGSGLNQAKLSLQAWARDACRSHDILEKHRKEKGLTNVGIFESFLALLVMYFNRGYYDLCETEIWTLKRKDFLSMSSPVPLKYFV